MRFYKALLHLYPKSFRSEYAGQMCTDFFESRTSLFAATLDVFRNAPAAHWDILRQDLRYTARTLVRSKGFAAVAILVLALGIGANTAVFSITDQVLIRPLPFPDAGRLITLWETLPGYSHMELSPANYRDWKRMATVFGEMGAYTYEAVNLVGIGTPERLRATKVSGNLFRILQVPPLIGRAITESDDGDGAPHTAVLGYTLWQRSFGASSTVLGQKLLLNGVPYTVIGVMPPQFRFPNQYVDLWLPLSLAEDAFADRNDNYLYGIGRLRSGISLQQARAELNVIADRMRHQYPKELSRTGAAANFMRDEISDQRRMMLMALTGAAFCVLLIACTNLANLLFARALNRRKELAVRAALGAGRERLTRQLLTESLVLSMLGGLLGILLANLALPLLQTLVPPLPASGLASIDMRVMTFALMLTLLTGIAFGVLPALRACRGDFSGLREGSRSGGGRKTGIRSVLILTEITLSMVLLVSAGLLLQALLRVESTDPGFRTDGVLTLQTPLPMPKYEKTAARTAFYNQVLSEIRAIPGVADAAYISFLPISVGGGIFPVDVDGKTNDRSEGHTASLRFITPGYFNTLSIPMHLGRAINDSDTITRPSAAVVSESFARRYWPGQNPLGRHFRFAYADRIIVGIVGDVRMRGLERTSEPQVYLADRQTADGYLTHYSPQDLAIRTTGNPWSLAPQVRQIIQRTDPDQPIVHIRTLDQIVDLETAPRTLQLRIIGAFAGLAFLLAGIGIHGLLSFSVSTRSGEIAVRIALGARPRHILGIVLHESTRLAIGGVVTGTALAYAAGRAMQSLLAGTTPGDTTTFLIAAALCLLMTLAGSLIPCLRALGVDAITAIRAE